MRKNLWQILALCLGISFLASAALAKVWLLPDYQARQFFSHRVNDLDSSTPSRDPQEVNCHTYGLIPASEIGEGMSCSSQTKIMNTTCYGDCVCAPAYNKTESSCRLEGKIPGGSACMGEYYTECLCDTSLYPYTSSSCVYNLGGASCSDKNGTHYSKCVNPCEGLVDNTTDLGCEKYYAECPSKCEVGKTCMPNDCSSYTLSSCPEGYRCETCTPGCGKNTKKYKTTGCNGPVTYAYTEEELITTLKKDCQTIYIADNITLGTSLRAGDGTVIIVDKGKTLAGKNGTEIYFSRGSNCFVESNTIIRMGDNSGLKDIIIGYINRCNKSFNFVEAQSSSNSSLNITLDNIVINGDFSSPSVYSMYIWGKVNINATNVVVEGYVWLPGAIFNSGNFVIVDNGGNTIGGTVMNANFVGRGNYATSKHSLRLGGNIYGGTFVGASITGGTRLGGNFYTEESPEYNSKREELLSNMRSAFKSVGIEAPFLDI